MSTTDRIRRVRLLQLPVPTLVPEESTGNVSLGAGALVAHAQEQNKGALDFSEVAVFSGQRVSRLGDACLLSALTAQAPDAVGFTVTAWNVQRTLALCSRLRECSPQTRIWLGGPEVASDAWFVQPGAPERRLFDAAVQGEGESGFAALLAGMDPCQVPGSVLGVGDRPQVNSPLGAWPSSGPCHGDPFLCGAVEPDMDGTVWVELSRGCRHGCAFCRYHGGRGSRVVARKPESVTDFFRWARKAEATQVYILDPSLEQHPYLDELLKILSVENAPPRLPLCVEMRAEAVDTLMAKQLYKAGVAKVECGLQTLTPEAMRRMGRRVDWPRFVQGVKELTAASIEVRIDLMLGLPGDSPQEMLTLFEKLGDAGLAELTQPFRTQVLPGTRLRSLAPKWGTIWEQRPPYRVLRTPTWDQEHLRQSLAWAGDCLGVNTAPDDEPVLNAPEWIRWPKGAGSPDEAGGRGWEHGAFPGQDDSVVAQYSWNLNQAEGQRQADAECFANAGFPCTLWMTGGARHLPLMTRILRRFDEANPFVPASLVVQVPRDELSACVDALLEAACTDSYLDRVYEGAGLHGSLFRRLYLALPVEWLREWERAELAQLRRRVRLLWVVPVRAWEEVGSALGRWPIPAEDLLLLTTSLEGAIPEGVFQRIFAESFYPDQVVWDRVGRQWRWRHFLDRVRGEGVT